MSNPPKIFISVDFPEPEWPIIDINSPFIKYNNNYIPSFVDNFRLLSLDKNYKKLQQNLNNISTFTLFKFFKDFKNKNKNLNFLETSNICNNSFTEKNTDLIEMYLDKKNIETMCIKFNEDSDKTIFKQENNIVESDFEDFYKIKVQKKFDLGFLLTRKYKSDKMSL